MPIGWILLGIFLAGYFAFAWAVIWNLRVYAFSKQAKWMTRLFLTLAVLLALMAVLSFNAVRWNDILNSY